MELNDCNSALFANSHMPTLIKCELPSEILCNLFRCVRSFVSQRFLWCMWEEKLVGLSANMEWVPALAIRMDSIPSKLCALESCLASAQKTSASFDSPLAIHCTGSWLFGYAHPAPNLVHRFNRIWWIDGKGRGIFAINIRIQLMFWFWHESNRMYGPTSGLRGSGSSFIKLPIEQVLTWQRGDISFSNIMIKNTTKEKL